MENNKSDRLQVSQLKMLTVNCEGFSRNSKFMYELLKDGCIDFLCAQETWLLESDLDKLRICNRYMLTGGSGCDSSIDIVQGHPPGGTVIYYHKKLAHLVTPIKTDHRRLSALSIRLNDIVLLLICVYMPCDSGSKHQENPEYVDTLNAIELICEKSEYDAVIYCGDWNTCLSRDNAQTKCLMDFCYRNNLKVCWENDNSTIDDTYVNFELNHASCIDYCVMSNNMFECINECNVQHCVLNLSHHSPVVMNLQTGHEALNHLNENVNSKKRILWHKVTDENINQYKSELDRLLEQHEVNMDVLNCSNVLCNDPGHKQYIDSLCNILLCCCLSAGEVCFPHSKPGKTAIPDWNDVAEPVRENALFWHWLWNECGRPHNGAVADIMRRTRAKYHYSVRKLRREANECSRRKLAESVANDKSQRDLWQEIKKMKHKTRVTSGVIDDCHNDEDICNLFASKYETLYQSVPTDNDELEGIQNELRERMVQDAMQRDCHIDVGSVKNAIKKLNYDKSDGRMGTYSNHFIYSSDRFIVILSLLIKCMFVHGHTASDLLAAVLVSIPKDVRASLCNSDNYRGIALCCALCKVVDILILCEHRQLLNTSDLQFAFKEGHSTVLCTTALKETVEYFKKGGSNVYACLLDASKAFDRVHYGKLFRMLLDREIPAVVIRLLLDCYTRQNLYTTWNGQISRPVTTLNGVKQGGILSPILFCVYFDELLARLTKQPAGCRVGRFFAGCVAYADDVTLLCPTPQALQRLVNVCEEYGTEYNVKFNEKKTVCICFGQKNENVYDIKMNGKSLKWSNEVKHLGNYINSECNEKKDIQFKKGIFLTAVNKLLANFGHVNCSIIAKLFGNYCCSFYGSQAWDLTSDNIDTICIAWHKAVRRIWKVPYNCHTRYLQYLMKTLYVRDQFVARFAKFYNVMKCSKNKLIAYLAKRAQYSVDTALGRSLVYVNLHYGTKLWCGDYSHENFKELLYNAGVSPEAQQSGTFLRECCEVRDGDMYLDGLNNEEMNTIIMAISTG